MALDLTGLEPLDTSGLSPVGEEKALDTSGLEPLDTSGLEPVADPVEPGPTTKFKNPVARGLAAGVDQVQGLGYGLIGLAGDAVGSDTIRDYGIEGYQRNMAEAEINAPDARFTEIDSVSEAIDWAGYTIGNLAPTMATSLLGGGVGGLAAKKGIKELAEKLVAEQVAKGVAKKEAAKIAGKAIGKRVAAGGAIGAGTTSVGMSSGEIYGSTEDVGVSLSHGLVAGAVDALPVIRVLDKLGLGKEAGDQIKGSILKEMSKQGALEGGTEAFQTLVEQHAQHWVATNGQTLLADLDEVEWTEVIDATAAGFLGGTVMGGGSQAVQNYQAKRRTLTGDDVDTAATPLAETPNAGEIKAAAEQGQRVRLGEGEESLSGSVVSSKEFDDGSFAVTVLGDDDNLYTVTNKDGVSITEEAGPESEFVDMEPGLSLDDELGPAPINQPAPREQAGLQQDEYLDQEPIIEVDYQREIPLLEYLNKPGGVMQMPGPVRGERDNKTQQAFEGSFPEYDHTEVNKNREQAALEKARLSEASLEPEPALDLPAPTVDQVRAQNLDPRFADGVYRDRIARMANELEYNGNITYTRDENDRVIGRTQSQNPQWFKDQEGALGSTKDVKETVRRALNGEKLTGPRQQRTISAMLDAIEDERADQTDPDVWAEWDSLLDEAKFRAAVDPADPTPMDAWVPIPDASLFGDGTNAPLRTIATLWDEALTVGVTQDQLEAIDRASTTSEQLAEGIFDAIRRQAQGYAETAPVRDNEGGREDTAAPAETAGGLQSVPTESEPAEQSREVEPAPTFGLQTQTEAELQERERAREAAEQEAAQKAAAAEQKAKADSEAKDFRLTGSEAPADVAMAGGQNDLLSDIDGVANEAATSPANDTPEPTPAQIEAGNYKKGHIRLQGLDISIENPKGSKRSGTDPDGNEWSQELAHHYGYIKRTEGADGEHVDVFVGPKTESDSVFIVDQLNADGSFDEHKVMLGFTSQRAAKVGYRANYQDGWKVGPITKMSMADFKAWLKEGDTTKPVSGEIKPKAVKSEAPEHRAVGVDDRELSEIVKEFNDAQASMIEDGEKVTHIFDAPKKSEIVRLNDKVKVYHKEHGWMTPAEAKARIQEWKDHAASQLEDASIRSENGQRIVLSLFDLTGKWSQPWRDAGYQVYQFDIQADWFYDDDGVERNAGDIHNFTTQFFSDMFGDFEGNDVYAILAACPCTDFASSGSRHFAAKDADGRTVASVKLVQQTLATIEYFKPPIWAIENPVGRIEKLGGLPPWRLSFDPNHMGEDYTKKTLLWGRFNADLPIAPTEATEGSKMHKKYGGKSLATKNARSATPEGFAYSFFMANNAHDHPAMAIANKYDRLDRNLIEQAVKAGATEEDISAVVDDPYYFDLDDEAGNAALQELIDSRKNEPSAPEAQAESPTESDVDAAAAASGQPAYLGPVGSYGEAESVLLGKPPGSWVYDLPSGDLMGSGNTSINVLYVTPRGTITSGGYADTKTDAYDLAWGRAQQFDGLDLPEEGQSAAKPEPTKKPKTYGKSNKVFTEDAAEKARALLKSKLSQTNAGLDPEMMQAGITLAGYHIEAGARSFADFAKAMLADLGDGAKPYLRSWYEGVRYYPGHDASGMTPAAEADTIDLDTLEQSDAERAADNQESDSTGADAQRSASGDLFDGAGGRGRSSTDEGGAPASRQGRADSSVGDRGPDDVGKRGDKPVSSEKSQLEPGAARDTDDRGSLPDSTGGALVDAAPSRGTSESVKKAPAQKPVIGPAPKTQKPADLDQVKAQMPFLTEGQAMDVVFAETRFSKPAGFGVLFTNGTGTGKTFSGLGVIRRAVNEGKRNILIVVPKQAIADAWVKAGRGFFGLDITPLASTKDAGDGIVVTTYANLGENSELVHRDWDMFAIDEAHYLSSDQQGSGTKALRNLQALSLKSNTATDRVYMQNPDDVEKMRALYAAADKKEDQGDPIRADALRDEADAISRTLRELAEAERERIEGIPDADKPRAIFLSATPFAYEKSVQWGQEFLFDWRSGKDSQGSAYNEGGDYEQFMMTHFGYRMRYNKLTAPEAEVDSGLMQRNFNTWLKKQGALSARALDSDHDYDRLFVMTPNALGRRVDEALDWLRNRASGDAEDGAKSLAGKITSKNFDYHARMYFLEAIKAREAVPVVKAHLEQGRKVLVMHDFKKGGAVNPFRLTPAEDERQHYEAFRQEFSDLINAFSTLPSPIDSLTAAFPDALVYNGNFTAKKRVVMQDRFNDDADDAPRVMIAQGDAMREGVSIHDTSGKFPRVLVHLGMPVKPTAAIQQEGRIFRTGQASDAMFRYLTIGSNWERTAFASKIAGRASAAENLAMGEAARGLKEAFINAYEEADLYTPGFEGEGKGGREADAALVDSLTPWDTAKALYFGTKKQGKGRSSRGREHSEFFATPEPVGMKMVQFADMRPGESALEPSAGHGAIARWFPDDVTKRAIEYTSELSSRLALHFDGDLQTGDFMEHNVVNKYDSVVMNPPFGKGGADAMKHVEKAMKHVRDGGRVVALIPTGPAADKKFDKLLESETAKDFYAVAEIRMPGVTFERAGTSVATRILVLEKQTDKELAAELAQVNRDYSSISTTKELFDRMESLEIPARQKPLPVNPDNSAEQLADTVSTGTWGMETWEAEHTKTGETLYMAKAKSKLSREAYKEVAASARRHGGYWSRFGKAGFLFKSEEGRRAFIDENLGDTPQFSLRARKSSAAVAVTPLSNEKVNRIAVDILGVDTVKRRIVVTPYDALPERIKEQADAQGASAEDVRAVHWHGKTYLVAEQMTSRRVVEEAIFHEFYGHYGLRARFQKQTIPVLVEMFERVGGLDGALRLAEQQGIDLTDYVEGIYNNGEFNERYKQFAIMDELLAHMSEATGSIKRLIQEFIGAVRAFLRRNGYARLATYTASDLAVVLKEARQSAVAPRAESAAGEGGRPMFSLREAENRFDDLDEGQKSFMGKIGPQPLPRQIKDRWQALKENIGLRIRQAGVDRYAALLRNDQALMGEDTLEGSIASSGWVLARMSNSAGGALSAMMGTGRIFYDAKNKVIDVREGTTGLADTLSRLGSPAEIDRFMAWVAANRARKLMGEGRENLFTEEEIAAGLTLNQGKTADNRARSTLYAKVWREFQEYRNDVLDIADATGLLRKALSEEEALMEIAREEGIGKRQLATIRKAERDMEAALDEDEREEASARASKAYEELNELVATEADDFDARLEILMTDQRDLWAEEFYVPFYRVLDEESMSGPSSGGRGAGLTRQQAYKRLKGGTQNLNDLLENTLLNFHHLLQASLKNRAADQALNNASALGIAEPVAPSERDKRNSTYVLRNGMKVWHNISDPLTFKALTALQDTGLNTPVMRLGRSFKRFFTNMTTITPQFVVANAIRDTLSAVATSPVSGNVGKNLLQGAMTYGNDFNKARMMASGGAFSFGHIYGTTPDDIKKNLAGDLNRLNIRSGAKVVPALITKSWQKWNDVTNAAENLNRAAIWSQNADTSTLKAAFEARDLMDFSSHGDALLIRILSDLVPFMNARLQGLDKLYRVGFKTGAKTLTGRGTAADKRAFARFATVIGALSLVSMALYLRNKDDEDYEKLEDWQRDTYWFIKIGDNAFFIPKPFEVGAIATITERALEQYADPAVGGEAFTGYLSRMLFDTFALNPTPQMVKPALELGMNRDTFTDRPIESIGMQLSGMSPSLRSRHDTTNMAKAASKGLESVFGPDSKLTLSPVQIDHLVKGYTGQVGATVAGVADTLWRTAQGEESPARHWHEYQPIRRFYRDLTKEPGYTRYGTLFYDSLKETQRVYADVRELQKLGEIEEAGAVVEKYRDKLAVRKALNRVQRRLSKLNKEVDRVRRDKTMSAEAKRMELDRLNGIKNALTEQVAKTLEARKLEAEVE